MRWSGPLVIIALAAVAALCLYSLALLQLRGALNRIQNPLLPLLLFPSFGLLAFSIAAVVEQQGHIPGAS